jgi:hypothetical protein
LIAPAASKFFAMYFARYPVALPLRASMRLIVTRFA